MASRLARVLAASACAVIGLVALAGTGGVAASSAPPGSTSITTPCAAPAAGHRTCMVRSATGLGRRPAATSRGAAAAPAGPTSGLHPQDVQAAYNIAAAASTLGGNQLVAVIDAFDNPKVASDLAAFRSNFGLPPCSSGNGCFQKVDESGGNNFTPANNSGWGAEIDLDVEAVSAACPRCRILLVEANGTDDSNFINAVKTAARLGATQISMSVGGCEGSSPLQGSFDAALRNAGVPITVSSGDDGYLSGDNPNTGLSGCRAGTPSYPASSPYVIAVGGTSLVAAPGARGWQETAWAWSGGSNQWGGGSGCSSDEPKPAWQHDTGCPSRMVADVSAVADPQTGLAFYDTYAGDQATGWSVVGGTSLSAPLVAAIDALGGATGTGAQAWYSVPLFDVTSGSNAPLSTDCSPAYWCNAAPGYDGPTGGGTPDGVVTPTRATGWAGARSLGDGPLNGDPQVVSPGAGTSYTFWKGTDGGLWFALYSNGSWRGPGSLGGSLAGDPHPVSTGGGTIDVFWTGVDGNLWHVYEVGGRWASPSSLGGGPMGSEPQVAGSGRGDVSVFWKGTDSNLWEAAYRPGVGWRIPIGLGSGPLGGPPHPAAFAANSYDVFWRGTDNNIWHTFTAGAAWSGPGSLGMGPVAGDPIPVVPAAHTINLYWQGTDDGLWQGWYAGGWHGPRGFGGSVASQPAPISPSAGQADVFWRATDGDAWHLVGGWPEALFEPNLRPTAVPSAFSWGGGHEEVVWWGQDGNLWHDWAG